MYSVYILFFLISRLWFNVGCEELQALVLNFYVLECVTKWTQPVRNIATTTRVLRSYFQVFFHDIGSDRLLVMKRSGSLHSRLFNCNRSPWFTASTCLHHKRHTIWAVVSHFCAVAIAFLLVVLTIDKAGTPLLGDNTSAV